MFFNNGHYNTKLEASHVILAVALVLLYDIDVPMQSYMNNSNYFIKISFGRMEELKVTASHSKADKRELYKCIMYLNSYTRNHVGC